MAKVFTNTMTSVDYKDIPDDWSMSAWILGKENMSILRMFRRGSKPLDDQYNWAADEIRTTTLGTAIIDGDRLEPKAGYASDRYSNYVQIWGDVASVGTVSKEYKTASKDNTLGYQISAKVEKLMQEVQETVLSRQASVKPVGNTPGKVSAINNFLGGTGFNAVNATGQSGGEYDSNTNLTTNITKGTSGVALTEASVVKAMQAVQDQGCSETNYCAISKNIVITGIGAFSTNSQRQIQVRGSEISDYIDVYTLESGHRLKLITNTNAMNQPIGSGNDASYDLLLVDPKYIRTHFVVPFKTKPMGTEGAAESARIVAAMTVSIDNPKRHTVLRSRTVA